MQRVTDWFLGLRVGQKVLTALVGGLFVFSVSYLVATVGLSLLGYGDEAVTPSGPSPAVTTPSPPHRNPSPRSQRTWI